MASWRISRLDKDRNCSMVKKQPKSDPFEAVAVIEINKNGTVILFADLHR